MWDPKPMRRLSPGLVFWACADNAGNLTTFRASPVQVMKEGVYTRICDILVSIKVIRCREPVARVAALLPSKVTEMIEWIYNSRIDVRIGTNIIFLIKLSRNYVLVTN